MNDIRVVHRRTGTRFAIEAFENLLIARHFAFEQLDGNVTFQRHIVGAINRAHAAGSDHFAQFELANAKRNDNGVSAFAARHGLQRRQFTGDPVLRLATAAHGQPERLSTLGCFGHWEKDSRCWLTDKARRSTARACKDAFHPARKRIAFVRVMPKNLLNREWVQWLLYFAIWTLIGLAFAGQSYLARAEIGDRVTWRFALSRNLTDWYIFAVLSLPVLWLARRIPIESGDWKRRVTIHAVASIVFSVLWMVLRASIVTALQLTEGQRGFWAAFTFALVATFFFNVLIYWVIISITHTWRLYHRDRDREVRTAELEGRLSQARLQALQMQLNPHFLFNTLHAISSLMHKDVDAADRMLIRLGDLLRYALESTEEQEVKLRQELDFLDRYIDIERARFGDRLAVEKDIAPDTYDALLPNLLLQPIIENAIQHGIEPHARPGKIALKAARDGNAMRLEVRDNGDGLPGGARPQEGVGISNSRARLQQLYGDQGHFQLANAPEGGLIVSIVVPWRTEQKRA